MGTPDASNATELVRAVFLASNRGDVEAIVERLHPQVEWESVGVFLHPAGVARGRDAVRSGLHKRADHYGAHPRVTLTDIREEGSRVYVQGILDAPGGGRLPETWICEFRDDHIFRVSAVTGPRR